MFVAPTEDHLEIVETVHELLAQHCSADTVRRAWDEGPPLDLWHQLADVGVLAALVPEELGGSGLDESFLYLLAVEMGYAAVPLPVLETMCLGPLLVACAAEGWDSVTTDGAMATWGDPDLLPWGNEATLAVARVEDGLRWAEGRPERSPTIDRGRPLAVCRGLGDALPVSADQRALLEARATVAVTGALVGLARRMLDLAVEYTRNREQFGRPIGAFQAVKHHLADTAVAIEFADPVGLAAGWHLAEYGPAAPETMREVAAAKLLASRAATVAARKTLQVHGAMGYTTEYDLHLYMKRAWALTGEHGTPADHRRTIADSLGLNTVHATPKETSS